MHSTDPIVRSIRSWLPWFSAAATVALFVIAAAPLLGQDGPRVSPPTTPMGALAFAALVPLIGWMATKLYDGVKTVFPFIDRLPPVVHQVAAPITQALFGAVATATGAELLTDIHAINAGWIGGILTFLLAGGIKRAEKAKHPADATLALERSRLSTAAG